MTTTIVRIEVNTIITAEFNFQEIVDDIEKAFSKDKWLYIASVVYAKILRLVNSSTNVDGARFMPYSPKYAKLRLGKGLSATVNLQRGNTYGNQVSGRMLQSINFRATNQGFELYINGDKNNTKAIVLNSSKNWKFFEWGKELEKELDKGLRKVLREFI